MRRTLLPIVRRRGFTLMELLVVIGIILLLLGILLPSIGRARHQAQRTRLALDLQTISMALDAYRQAHQGLLPRLFPKNPTSDVENPDLTGAQVLCRALIAPQEEKVDGAEGPGYRIVKAVNGVQQGKPIGPWLPPDQFKISPNFEILDRNDSPILYYPANKSSPVSPPSTPPLPSTPGYIAPGVYGDAAGAKPRYNWTDNVEAMNSAEGKKMSLQGFRRLMGDANANGWIDPGESPAYVGDFVLWSAGPDGNYGPDDQTKPVSSANRCDDVANFERSEY